jgi:hypothetical protein
MLNSLSWMRDEDYGSVVKSGYLLLEATQSLNQLYVHRQEKLFSSLSENSMVLLIILTPVLVLGLLHHVMLCSSHVSCLCQYELLEFPLKLSSFHCSFYIYLWNWFILHSPSTPSTQTEFVEIPGLCDEFLFAFQYLGSWDSTLLLCSFHLGLHICHKSPLSFA